MVFSFKSAAEYDNELFAITNTFALTRLWNVVVIFSFKAKHSGPSPRSLKSSRTPCENTFIAYVG